MPNLDTMFDTIADSNEGAVMEVKDKFGAVAMMDDKPMTITLLGKDSDVFVENENKITNRRLAQGQRVKLTAQAIKSDSISTLARATKAWEGFKDTDGSPMPCTYENAVKLYQKYPLIREQVDEFISDRTNFSKAS